MVVIRNPGESEWLLVSVIRPCPVCGGAGACRVNSEGSFVCCVEVPSDCAVTPGAWLHRAPSSAGAHTRATV